jgi:hypothetical protein
VADEAGGRGGAGRRARAAPRFAGPPEVVKELTRLERAGSISGPVDALKAGERLDPIPIGRDALAALIAHACRRALGRASARARTTEVIWRDGADELAVDPGRVTIETRAGAAAVTIPVRCDQSGPGEVEVVFALGSPDRPAGLFAATDGRPRGPSVVVERWADPLTALAWSALLELAESVSAGMGRDRHGNRLIPGSLVATEEGLEVVPLARHRLGRLQS